MKTLLAASTLALVAAGNLATEYRTDRILVVDATFTMETELVDFEMLVDGEPMDRGNRAGSSTSLTRHLVTADRVLAAGDDGPSKVQREFREVSGSNQTVMGDREMGGEAESPLEGVTLELELDDGDVTVTVADGESQEDAQLQGHQLALALDALLPEDEVEEGDTWDLDKGAIGRALGLDLQQVLFVRPERGERGEGEGRGGGGRGGRRGQGGGGGLGELMNVDWEGEAKLVGTEEVGGEAVYAIQLKLEASGELPERERGGGRRDRSAGPVSILPTVLSTTLELNLEGTLYVSVKGRRPVSLSLEGDLTRETERIMDRGDRTMEMSSTTEGTLSYTVEVSEEAAE